MRAFDISNYSAIPMGEQAALLRDQGRKAIVGCHDPVIAIAQIQALRAHCVEVELYQHFYFSIPLQREIDKLEQVIDAIGFAPRIWIAEEDTVPAGVSPDVVVGWIQEVIIQTVADLSPTKLGIYTRKGWWQEATADTTRFTNLPLWVAQYDGISNLSVYDGFGGWWTCAMKQYDNDVDIGGVNVDLDVY